MNFYFSINKTSDFTWISALQLFAQLLPVALLAWSVWQYLASVREQRRYRSEQTLLTLALTWNGKQMLKSRLVAESWLAKFPVDQNPQEWIERQCSGSWIHFSRIAHFLAHVNALVDHKIIEASALNRHIGAGGWWASELKCLYNYFEDEHRVVEALESLQNNYPRFRDKKRVNMPDPR